MKYIVLALLIAITTGAEAKSIKMAHVYMFGFSASFQDSTVYMTDIQDVQGAWMDTKTNFLLGRDNYSYQLKNYLADQGQPNRVCVVFFATNKNKAEKQYLKLRKKYTEGLKSKKKKNSGKGTTPTTYEIKYLTAQEFRFEPVDMSE